MLHPEHLAPPLRLLLREGLSVVARFAGAIGRLRERGPADGPPLLVIPGFLASDHTTLPLQRELAREGYRVAGWGLGLNRGATADLLGRIVDRVEAHGRGRPVVLVGWSLGGVFAREVAKLRPELVARVVTMGTPFSGSMRANNAWRLYERVAGHPVDRPPIDADVAAKPPVHTLALWSRRDGVVAPAAARGEAHERDGQLELRCGHMAFATSRRAVREVARALRD